MRLEILVEEASAEPVVRRLLSLIDSSLVYDVRVFQGKPDLLKQLPSRMAGYRDWARAEDVRILVLCDEDREDCRDLKNQMEEAAITAGLSTKSSSGSLNFRVVNRIAVEELEAWLLGDHEALCAAFPRVPTSYHRRARYRQPDEIRGGTAEALEKLLKDHGYHSSGLRKVEAASAISRFMVIDQNKSPSFRCLVAGITSLVNASPTQP